MLDGATGGLIGGLIGSAIGILGGAFGTWMSIRNTRSARERRMAVRYSLIAWVVALVVLIAAFLIPQPWTFVAFVPVWVGLPFFIIGWNRTAARIRAEEQAQTEAAPDER